MYKHKRDKAAENLARWEKQQREQGHLTEFLSDDNIVEALTTLEDEQIVALLTLFWNLYEKDYMHIWFAKGVRIDKINTIADIIESLKSKQLFSDNNLPDVFTGMGIDDYKRGY